MTTTRPTLSPEARLLLLTASASPSAAAVRGLVGAGIDWDDMWALAQEEKAAAILLRELGRIPVTVPDAGYQQLQQLARVSVMQQLQLERLLHQVLDALAGRRIEAMLLKGSGLAYTAYPSFADRPMGDLDLLIRPAQAEQAWHALQSAGWIWPSAQWEAGRYVAHQHLPPLLHEPGRFRLEIHRHLLPEGHPFRLSDETLWGQAQRVTVDGRVLVVPHRVHQLWHACVHFAWSHQMQWGAWRALRDCAMLSQGGRIDWAEFIELARESRARTCCYWTLRLARRLVGAAVPDDVLLALRPPRSDLILGELERHFTSNLFPSPNRCPSVWLARRLWEAGMLPGWSGHGPARPWHVAERWEVGADPLETAPSRIRPPVARIRKLGAWAHYLLWIHRLVLPSEGDSPMPSGGL